jgi:hypothetical protein
VFDAGHFLMFDYLEGFVESLAKFIQK